MSGLRLERGDCAEVMASMESNSVDAIVTDPPYGLSFMNKEWDSFGTDTQDKSKLAQSMVAFQESMTPIFAEALRVAKPGAHLLCFGGTRTFHRMACAIEDAGWECRDCIMWVYGSGFPHSMDVGKAIDKALGAKRPVVGHSDHGSGPWQGKLANHGRGDTGIGIFDGSGRSFDITGPATEQAKQWDGWGTCLKPAWEPIIVARKPLDGTVANNVLKWGTGAINIDGCRVPTGDKLGGGMRAGGAEGVWDRPFMHDKDAQAAFVERKKANIAKSEELGRFPANLAHDGSDDVLALFPDTGKSSGGGGGVKAPGKNGIYGTYNGHEYPGLGDSGNAARFFYCAKANKKDRGEGNDHPTVKPTELMSWLVRLVTPQGGVVLDPFMGSGSTGVAAKREGMGFIGIERDEHYFDIASSRLKSEPATLF